MVLENRYQNDNEANREKMPGINFSYILSYLILIFIAATTAEEKEAANIEVFAFY